LPTRITTDQVESTRLLAVRVLREATIKGNKAITETMSAEMLAGMNHVLSTPNIRAGGVGLALTLLLILTHPILLKIVKRDALEIGRTGGATRKRTNATGAGQLTMTIFPSQLLRERRTSARKDLPKPEFTLLF